jgi:hypothetical protein
MTESDKPTSGDDDWGGPEETPWQEQPAPPPQEPQQPSQPPPYGGTPPPQYGQQPPQYGSAPPPQYGAAPQYGGPPTHQPGQRLPNYLVHNIIATILCCLPLGVVGIVFASQVNGKLAAGDYAGAKKASDNARLFFIISIVAGVVVGVFYGFYLASQGSTY